MYTKRELLLYGMYTKRDLLLYYYSKVMYFIFLHVLHFIQYIHYDTAMATAVRIRSGLGLYFTPLPL